MKIFGVTGWKNAGKTGLMERLVAEFTARGLRVSTVKHAHHAFDVDRPGKDSHRHRAAGAVEVLLTATDRWALMHEARGAAEPGLKAHLARLSPVDLVLVEGFKGGRHPKIEAHRAETGNGLIAAHDTTVRAIASDQGADWAGAADLARAVFDLDDTSGIADFIAAEVGLAAASSDAPVHKPAKLARDCFAHDTDDVLSVPDALANLRGRLQGVTGQRRLAVTAARGRILASDLVAPRDNPPFDNACFDGFVFRHPGHDGPVDFPLMAGRAAAGVPFDGTVAPGSALRVLTGAVMPAGADTVVMQEDVIVRDDRVLIDNPPHAGANIRQRGEDTLKGDVILRAGTRLDAAKIAHIAGLGIHEVAVRHRLTVGVLSTGDELVRAGKIPGPGQINDTNRPMLMALIEGWGHRVVDLGQVWDRRSDLDARLTDAANRCDVILTSGGASGGDEDHLSAILGAANGRLQWRIRMKPGRPLVMGLVDGVPLFGLPGNPVAALTCALIFARPALSVLAGGDWLEPVAYQLPAGFAQDPKPGRTTFLRARIGADGRVAVYHTESSASLAGMSWSDGLVEIADTPDATPIRPGDLVRYLPLSGFGI